MAGKDSSNDQDTAWNFEDKQGRPFQIWAGSEGEAWRLAKVTTEARDEEYKAQQQSARNEKEQAHNNRIANLDNVIEDEYGRAKVVHQKHERGNAPAITGPTPTAAERLEIASYGQMSDIGDQKPWLNSSSTYIESKGGITGGWLITTIVVIVGLAIFMACSSPH